MNVSRAPGLTFEAVTAPSAPSALRTDIAGFVGRTRRGPVGTAVRVVGWREYQVIFGSVTEDADTPSALQGYFDNGGEVAHVVRLLGPFPVDKPGFAMNTWDLTRAGAGSPPWDNWDPVKARFTTTAYDIWATSPGAWANGLRVTARYRQRGASGHSEVDLVVNAPNEPVEYLIGLDPAAIVEQVAARSALIRLVARSPAAVAPGDGPQLLRWSDIVLASGYDPPVSSNDYDAGLEVLADVSEVAIVAVPDLVRDLPVALASAVQQRAVAKADLLHDRLVLLDLPSGELSSADAIAWSAGLRGGDLDVALRSAVAYHPWLDIQDELGGTADPVRKIASSGHVAGLISLLDRQRGAHYTPANATLSQVVDVTIGYSLAERGTLNDAGINLLRCSPNQGIQVWGGRTLHPDASWLYIAHRRLVHRLVRAIRRVAEPLVFETNGPALWLAFSRAVTTVLAEAFRAGGLKGSRPDEAFRITCDATNNPPEQIDLGQVVCEIQLAPAVPMEFITLRVIASSQGTLEVFES